MSHLAVGCSFPSKTSGQRSCYVRALLCVSGTAIVPENGYLDDMAQVGRRHSATSTPCARLPSEG